MKISQSFSPPGVRRFAAGEMLLRMLALVSLVRGGETRATTPSPAPFTAISVHPNQGATGTVVVNLSPSTWPPSSTDAPTPVVDPRSPPSMSPYCPFCDYPRFENGPDKLIPPYSRNITCGDLWDVYANATYPTCDVHELLPSGLGFFDLQAYCECTNTLPSFACTMWPCGEGDSVPEANYRTEVQVPGLGNLTCEEAAALTDYVAAEEYCQNWTQTIAGPCCSVGTAAPTAVPTSNGTESPTSDGVVVRKGGVMGATALGMAIAAALFS